MQITRLLCASALAWLVAACSVSTPLSLQSTGDGLSPRGSVALVVPEDETQSQRGRFASALKSAFTSSGVAIADKGEWVVDYALSVGSASGGVFSGDVGKDGESGAGWLTEQRRAGRFDKCDAKRMRATLVVLDRTNGTTLYRGNASRIDCNFSNSDITDMAKALVADAIRRTGASVG